MNVLAFLKKNLKHYEILHADSLQHRIVKRGLQDSYHPFNKIKEIEFETLGRNFRLILSPSQSVLHPKFKAYVVDENGEENHVHVDRDNFYKGRVFGESKSEVRVHLDEDGVMMGSIHLPDEVYHVEPSWRHLADLDNRTMITYKESDIKLSWDHSDLSPDEIGLKTCGYIRENNDTKTEHHRTKRQTDSEYFAFTKTRCPLMLVADYRFYREMGGGNSKTTINYLVIAMQILT